MNELGTGFNVLGTGINAINGEALIPFLEFPLHQTEALDHI